MNQENLTFLTTGELAELIRYDARTIRSRLVDSVLIEGIHYVRPFGRRKILYIWESIKRDLFAHVVVGGEEALASSQSDSTDAKRIAPIPSNRRCDERGASGQRGAPPPPLTIPLASGGVCHG